MTSTANWPVGEPAIVPSGTYRASVRDEMTKQQSKFDSAKSYFLLPLMLINREGETFDFSWAFSPRNPIYLRFLALMGGTIEDSGKVLPPSTCAGKTFMIKVTEQRSRDKSRQVNAVMDVWADHTAAIKERNEAAKAEEDLIEIPFE